MLIGGSAFKKGGRITSHGGGFSSVFPFKNKNGKKIAIKCWCNDIGDVKLRMVMISNRIKGLKLPYFLDFIFDEHGLIVTGTIRPIIAMEWSESLDLKEYINNNYNTNKVIFIELAENFMKMVKDFHLNNIAHGDLSHGNIKVTSNKNLLVIDYDSMFVEGMDGLTDNIKGLPGYQHPKRLNNLKVHNRLDYFSELIIYLSLIVYNESPELWVKYYGTEDFLFSKTDFYAPQNSSLIQSLLLNKNSTITYLTNYLIAALKFDDICQIEPLEDVLDKRFVAIANGIINKF